MSCYISQYVKTCDLCLWTKAQCQSPIRELALLPILEFHWDTISIDFIIKLLESHGYDAVMNVVDSVSKMSHFIPTHTTITALRVAHLFLAHVWKLMDFQDKWSPTKALNSSRNSHRNSTGSSELD